jgi:hypothetical protein
MIKGFVRGNFYRHKRFLDCKILVLKVQFYGLEYTKIKMEWRINRFGGYPLNVRQNMKIDNKDLKNWEIV